MVTSGDGLIYNVARARMLSATFRWTDTDKYAVDRRRGLCVRREHTRHSPTWRNCRRRDVAEREHRHQPASGAVRFGERAGRVRDPPQFAGEVWTQAIGSVVLSRFIGSTLQTADLTKYELIACLTTFLGGPIYPDGSPFSITYDQSNGQQGWFRP